MQNFNPLELRIKIFADGADTASILRLAKAPLIKGFTTNPTLMRKSGVTDYEAFSRSLLRAIPEKPISFEVISDEQEKMKRQALKIASWGKNVNVKIPVTNSLGLPCYGLIHELSHTGVMINVTAVFTLDQVRSVCRALAGGAPAIISVFAGRIADCGRDPIPHMKEALRICRDIDPKIELLWASPREALNIMHAEESGADIITLTPDLLQKMKLFGKDLEAFSRETVLMFKNDGEKAGYVI